MSKENLKRVAEFHDVSGLPYHKSPQAASGEKIDLRLALLQEELDEFEIAANRGDLSGVLDALVDLQYVLHGAVLDFGLQDVFAEAEAEIHRSNMSKFCENTEQARQSVIKYQLKHNIEAYYRLVNKKFVIRRSMDEKILKGLHYSPPEIKGIIDRHIQKINETVPETQG